MNKLSPESDAMKVSAFNSSSIPHQTRAKLSVIKVYAFIHNGRINN
ncbi:hypothetical protein [Pedobacter alpinus]